MDSLRRGGMGEGGGEGRREGEGGKYRVRSMGAEYVNNPHFALSPSPYDIFMLLSKSIVEETLESCK